MSDEMIEPTLDPNVRQELVRAFLLVRAHEVQTNIALINSAISAAEAKTERDLSDWSAQKRRLDEARRVFHEALVTAADRSGANVFAIEYWVRSWAKLDEVDLRVAGQPQALVRATWVDDSEFAVVDAGGAEDLARGDLVFAFPEADSLTIRRDVAA